MNVPSPHSSGSLRTRHEEAAGALLPAGRSRTEMLAHIAEVFEELEALAAGLRRLRELTPRTTDLVISRGERLSAQLLAGALEAAGTKARYVDALEVVHTDDAFGQASPDFAHTDRAAQRILAADHRSRRHSRRARLPGGDSRLVRLPPSVAAGPTSRPPCSPGRWEPSGCRSGRTCRDC